ncbi:BTAD domain-containing putative transcriptional regulator [Streptomyces sioyaensis]|uniref:AfsR/SARP family transcriptional regulator n=1 Tax=Streptomyces sioyaensis TaxID=67364 RepID=UPI003680450B
MELQLLGNIGAVNADGSVVLAGAKVRTALAALVLARGWTVPDSTLSSALWGWNPPGTKTAQLYTYMSRLRGLLGPEVELVRRQSGYLLRAEDAVVDVLEFERLAAEGARALRDRHFERAGRQLALSLRLWQGRALADVTEHFANAERPRLEEARAVALEDRLEADLAMGRHRELIPELTGLVHAFPVRERLRAQLMTALYRCDRQSDALAVYHHGRQLLADELGVDPGATLSATYYAVLNNDPALAAPAPGATEAVRIDARGAPSAADAPGSVPAMLPPEVGDFTGRQREATELLRLLPPEPPGGAVDGSTRRPRRFLLTGMAGIGKSTLAVHVAHTAAPAFPDGHLYADLTDGDGSAKDPRRVLVPLLRALGDDAPGSLTDVELTELVQRYRTRTAGRALLVVLDNLVSELQLDALLPSGSRSAVIVTSRMHLAATPGIHPVLLEPLRPGESLALLEAVAGPERLVREPDAARDVVTYCAGLPLALRIAGARLAARPRLPMAWLADRLAEPAARLGELRYGGLSVAESVARSARQLDEESLAVLRALPGLGGRPFTSREAAALLGRGPAEAERMLEALADARLLELPGTDERGWPLYRCPELVRLFADSLGEGALAPAGPSVRPAESGR